MKRGWILRREADGLFFTDACRNDERNEWIESKGEARVWADHASCCAAAQTWLAVKGESLEVVNVG
tara:strand:+ start:397 stop:594 length:198 start_codon:yes stop_codon:yes gene_type:complete